MAGRSPARFLAPIALIIFAFVLYNVVSSDEEPTSNTPAKQTATATPSETSSDEEKEKSSEKKKTKTYTVKAGDTASAIAEEAGMDLQTLLELNPDVDASSLSPGQKIVLER
jgi:LysM repeat protein